MAEASRPLIAIVVVAFVLVAAYLLVAQPQPQPQTQTPARSQTPFAPIETIQQAQDASALSDAANARLQAAGDAVEVP